MRCLNGQKVTMETRKKDQQSANPWPAVLK